MVLSCWNALEHGNKFRKTGLIIPESCPKPVKNTHFREEPHITAVSKLHGRAPNPRARQRGGRAPVEVGDFPFLESIFTIFGKLTGVFPELTHLASFVTKPQTSNLFKECEIVDWS